MIKNYSLNLLVHFAPDLLVHFVPDLVVHFDPDYALFNLINQLHEKASIIITTNKSPKEWAQTLEDEVLVTALLDRLLYRCEVVRLNGKSYRMENRKTIFESN